MEGQVPLGFVTGAGDTDGPANRMCKTANHWLLDRTVAVVELRH